jgi:RND family efflux transporter MFP subunit
LIVAKSKNMKSKKIILISTVSILAIIALAIIIIQKNKKTEVVAETRKDPIEVSGRSIKDLRTLKETIGFPALVQAEQEVKIIAKSSGNIKGLTVKPGDKVRAGQVLARIDDTTAGASNRGSGFNASQIKQASIAASQAAASYQLARNNYQNLLESAQKDINQLEISKDQASQGKANIGITTNEALKSAEIAHETAKIAVEQARLSLENRKKSIGQSENDTSTNARTSGVTVANSARSIITGLNNILGFDTTKGLMINYKKNLGALDSASLTAANNDYNSALAASDAFESARFYDANREVDAAIDLANKTKVLVDSSKNVLENTFTSVDLPQNSLAGNSLNSLISAVNGYQAQINGILSQINGTKQSLLNAPINNSSSLDALEQAYELAKKQEAASLQNLNNLKAGNKSQLDAASFGVKAANNQLDASKSKIESQISVSRSQVEIAGLQYQNAVATLQSLYDIREAVSPIDGTITARMVDENETVSPGQTIAIVSQLAEIKLQFYVDQENLAGLKVGQSAKIADSDNAAYPAKITSITPQADSMTKRFLVEVVPDKKDPELFALGTVMNVSLDIFKKSNSADSFLLPLSSIEVSQNGNSIFIIKDSLAAKANVEILRVLGESAEIKSDLPADTIIVIDGNKSIKEGDEVSLKF